jgi:lipopolysaccharide assembly outer membrane protein LptD (OstA)
LQKIFYLFILALFFLKLSFASIILEANQISNYKDGKVEAEGNVVVKTENETLYTQKLIYIKPEEKLIFPTKITVKTKDYKIEAKKGWYLPKEKKGEFFDAKISIKNQYFL